MPNRISQPRIDLRRTLLAGALLALTAPLVHAQVVIYDEFTGSRIDESRWVGREVVTREGGRGSLLEIQREVTSAQALVLQTRVASEKGDETGRYAVDNALMFQHAQALSEIVFDAAVRRIDVEGCAAGAEAEAGVRGVFALFNDGLGDVVAVVRVSRSSASTAPAGELQVDASVVHRTDQGESLLGYVSLGSTTLGRQVRLRTRWDPARNRVRFQRDAESLVAIDYTNPVIAAPGRPRKYLAATAAVSDCSASPTSAAVVAAIDNVRVNP
jgi:hypothetical protein